LATIGVCGTTSRLLRTVRRALNPAEHTGRWRQVQHIGNLLINELLIGIGSKDRFSLDEPAHDAQFASYFLDPPPIVAIVEALYGGSLSVPRAPRTDLLPLVTYAAPIAGARDALRSVGGSPAPQDRRARVAARACRAGSACSAATPPATRTAGGSATTWSTSRCASRWAAFAPTFPGFHPQVNAGSATG
jgi:hypothetical protein